LVGIAEASVSLEIGIIFDNLLASLELRLRSIRPSPESISFCNLGAMFAFRGSFFTYLQLARCSSPWEVLRMVEARAGAHNHLAYMLLLDLTWCVDLRFDRENCSEYMVKELHCGRVKG
jgi:hypothetical protein